MLAGVDHKDMVQAGIASAGLDRACPHRHAYVSAPSHFPSRSSPYAAIRSRSLCPSGHTIRTGGGNETERIRIIP